MIVPIILASIIGAALGSPAASPVANAAPAPDVTQASPGDVQYCTEANFRGLCVWGNTKPGMWYALQSPYTNKIGSASTPSKMCCNFYTDAKCSAPGGPYGYRTQPLSNTVSGAWAAYGNPRSQVISQVANAAFARSSPIGTTTTGTLAGCQYIDNVPAMVLTTGVARIGVVSHCPKPMAGARSG